MLSLAKVVVAPCIVAIFQLFTMCEVVYIVVERCQCGICSAMPASLGELRRWRNRGEDAALHTRLDRTEKVAEALRTRLDTTEKLLAEVTQRCEEERGSRKAVDFLNEEIQRCAEEDSKLLDDFTHRWAKKETELGESVEVLKSRVDDAALSNAEIFEVLKARLDKSEELLLELRHRCDEEDEKESSCGDDVTQTESPRPAEPLLEGSSSMAEKLRLEIEAATKRAREELSEEANAVARARNPDVTEKLADVAERQALLRCKKCWQWKESDVTFFTRAQIQRERKHGAICRACGDDRNAVRRC